MTTTIMRVRQFWLPDPTQSMLALPDPYPRHYTRTHG